MQFINKQKVLGELCPAGPIPDEKELISTTIKVAWPAMVETFLVAIVSIVDTMMVGSLGSHAISAVGLSTQPKSVSLTLFLALNIAMSTVVARRRGERDREDANKVLVWCLIFTVVVSIITGIVCAIYAENIMLFMGARPETLAYSRDYFKIVSLGMVFSNTSLAINAAQRGAGNTKIAMRTNVVSNLINLVMNYLLINGNYGFPRLEVKGAAIATVMGTVVACAMSLRSVCNSSGFLYVLQKEALATSKKSLLAMYNIGKSALAEQLFQRVGFMIYAKTIASLGTAAFAAHQIGINICQISFALGEGLSFAAIALVGRSLGEKRPDLAKLYSVVCFRSGYICSILCSFVFLVFGNQIFGLFTKDVQVLTYAPSINQVLCVVTFFQIGAVICSGCLRGAGDTGFIAKVSLITITIIRPGAAILFCYTLGFGLIGAWYGFIADVTLRFILLRWRFGSGKWSNMHW